MKLRIKKAQRGLLKNSVMPLDRPKDVSFLIYYSLKLFRSNTNIYQDTYMQKEEKEELVEDFCQVSIRKEQNF